jgi:hypothetical protein
MLSTRFEQKRWFKRTVSALAILSGLGLGKLAAIWPFGTNSVAAFFVLLFCLIGLNRFYTGLLGIVIELVRPRAVGNGQSTQ